MDNNRKIRGAVLTPDKMYVLSQAVIRGDKHHYVIIKESIQHNYITFLHIYAYNTEAPT